MGCLDAFAYDRLYSYRHGMVLETNAEEIVHSSAARHRRALNGEYPGGSAPEDS